MVKKIIGFVTLLAFCLFIYTNIGTCENVGKIKALVPKAFQERNWKIVRYDGFEYGSWNKHGGCVWYHVANIDNPAIQYCVNVALWNNELQFYYNKPELIEQTKLSSLK